MGDGFAFIDIILFAMVAVFLIFRLRSVLGRRTGTCFQRCVGLDAIGTCHSITFDIDGECGTVTTTLERRKGRNLVANPRVSLLAVDPDDTSRFIQIRGDAELVTDGALEDLDAVTRRYTAHPRYYGFVYPEDQAGRETRVICRIHARRVQRDASHA